jgi:hypothetical protein
MGKNLIKAGLLLAASLASGAALAQGGVGRAIERGGQEIEKSGRNMLTSPDTYFSMDNFTLEVGGGFSNFTQNGADDVSSTGGDWTVRGIFGIDQAIGIEGGYLGAAYPVTGLTGDDGTVFSNGIEALARVGYPIRRDRYFILPYLGAGLGVSLYNLSGVSSEESGIRENDWVWTIPLTAGIGGGYDRLSLDLRFVYRPSFGDSLFDAAVPTSTSTGLSTVAFTALVGYRF